MCLSLVNVLSNVLLAELGETLIILLKLLLAFAHRIFGFCNKHSLPLAVVEQLRKDEN